MPEPNLFPGGGAMGAAVRAFDWTTTPLGAPDAWPPALSHAVTLMLAGHVPAAPDTADPEPLADGHGTCVLVVEDNNDVGGFATQTLSELGYGTVWAIDAEAALAELAANPDRFDVVFSDVVMPGMNGLDLAREIQRLHPGLPVVLTSGYSHVLAESGSSGFELLQKPYSVEQLSRVLRKAYTWKRRRRILGR